MSEVGSHQQIFFGSELWENGAALQHVTDAQTGYLLGTQSIYTAAVQFYGPLGKLTVFDLEHARYTLQGG